MAQELDPRSGTEIGSQLTGCLRLTRRKLLMTGAALVTAYAGALKLLPSLARADDDDGDEEDDGGGGGAVGGEEEPSAGPSYIDNLINQYDTNQFWCSQLDLNNRQSLLGSSDSYTLGAEGLDSSGNPLQDPYAGYSLGSAQGYGSVFLKLDNGQAVTSVGASAPSTGTTSGVPTLSPLPSPTSYNLGNTDLGQIAQSVGRFFDTNTFSIGSSAYGALNGAVNDFANYSWTPSPSPSNPSTGIPQSMQPPPLLVDPSLKGPYPIFVYHFK
jgi:hypothetical protein